MKTYDWYPFWVVEFNSDPVMKCLSDNQELIHRRLLDASWAIGPLPSNPVMLASLARVSSAVMHAAWTYPLMGMWGEHEEFTIFNARLEIAREFMNRRSAAAKKGGLAAGKKRTEAAKLRQIIKQQAKESAGVGRVRWDDKEKCLRSDDDFKAEFMNEWGGFFTGDGLSRALESFTRWLALPTNDVLRDEHSDIEGMLGNFIRETVKIGGSK